MRTESIATWPAGRAVRFDFGAGERLSDHRAPADGLLVCLSGRLHVTLNDRAHELGAGECLPLADGDAHAVHAEERSTLLLVLVGSVPAQHGAAGSEGGTSTQP